MSNHVISPNELTISAIEVIIKGNKKLELSQKSKLLIIKCRNYLEKKLKNNSQKIYGVNTGFGALYNTPIATNDQEKLQKNLVLSHACGIGDEVPQEIVKIMLLLKIHGLAYGNSGIQLPTVERLIDLFNHDILPVVYQQGSLGASGDLVPLAHLTLPLIGEGLVNYKGEKLPSLQVLKKLNLKPISLKSKEGLAMLNGTQFMCAYATFCLIKSYHLITWANNIACISIDGFGAKIEPFESVSHTIRPHKGQIEVAKNIYTMLIGSEINAQDKKHLQDPYSFRCIPQVHGASLDTIAFVRTTVEIEINSVTDNPLFFPEEDRIVSSGNFHGQPLAMGLDFLAIAIAELGSISERRTYKLISGQRELPAFLIANPGLNSGLMIPHYSAASIVSQNKQLCTPASVDTIDSSNGQEDHVSMGANAATKALRVIENVETILSIELLTASQSIEFRRPLKSSDSVELLLSKYRKIVPFIDRDRYMYSEINNTLEFLKKLMRI